MAEGNEIYGILRGFASEFGFSGPPGLDLPGLDMARIAEGYGVPGRRVDTGEELAAELAEVSADRGPRLIEVPITTETRPLG